MHSLRVTLFLIANIIAQVSPTDCGTHTDCPEITPWCCDNEQCCTMEEANLVIRLQTEILLAEIGIIILNVSVVVVGCTFAFKNRCACSRTSDDLIAMNSKESDYIKSESATGKIDENSNYTDPAPPYPDLDTESLV